MTMPSLLDLTIVAPALVAGTLVLVTHVPLGMQILRRGIVFIDLALAQIAALGVIIAGLLDFDPQGPGTQLAAACAALLGAGLLTWTERRWPDVQEAQIGVLFVLAATGGLLLLANNPHGGEHLRDLLAGQILWVRYDQLLVPAIGTALVAALLVTKRAQLHPLLFYVVFALAVTASVQLVGVYLVFASLIVPGLATRHLRRRRLAAAYGVGLAGYATGLLLSTLVDLPSGAMIVWCMTACAILTFAVGSRVDSVAAV
jgi:zinc/manganese transport system permease protein